MDAQFVGMVKSVFGDQTDQFAEFLTTQEILSVEDYLLVGRDKSFVDDKITRPAISAGLKFTTEGQQIRPTKLWLFCDRPCAKLLAPSL